jgi:hypothetical protein
MFSPRDHTQTSLTYNCLSRGSSGKFIPPSVRQFLVMSLKRQGTDSCAGQKENKKTIVNEWCLLQIKIEQIFSHISVMRP